MNDGAPSHFRSFGNLLIALVALVALSFLAIPGDSISLGEGRSFVTPNGEILPEDALADGEVYVDEQGRVVRRNAAGGQTQQSRAGRTAGSSGSGSTLAGGQKGSGGAGTNPDGSPLECKAGRNGGATDKGVTGSRINLAATNVRSGQGESFLGTAWVGMQAVVNRVNVEGICGRQLSLKLVDDGWDGPRGAGFIKNFTEQDYFALPVVPSSEGLTVAIDNKTIRNAGIPVVGTDGMLKAQYFEPWVWPVAAATVTQMRVMAKYAIDRGAQTCGIVYDNKYKFGLEGAAAFQEYASASGCQVKAYVGIPPGEGNYGGYIKTFNDACDPSCDFVAMLLEPGTASTWISGQPFAGGKKRGFGSKLTSGAQPLFNERFGRDCGAPCDEMLVWTGYNPPVGGQAGKPGVIRYVNDVRSIIPDVDVYNQFMEGAYLGMTVFVEALKKVGPNLTRSSLKAIMDQLVFLRPRSHAQVEPHEQVRKLWGPSLQDSACRRKLRRFRGIGQRLRPRSPVWPGAG